jgi:hypothetical protein
MISWIFGVIDALFLKMFSIGEDQISCFRINWRGNDFMKNLYDHKILFWYCKIQGKKWKYISISTLCQLIIIGNVEQCRAQVK